MESPGLGAYYRAAPQKPGRARKTGPDQKNRAAPTKTPGAD